MAGTPVNPSSPLSAQNAPVGTGINPIAASHPGFIRESPSGELLPAGGGGGVSSWNARTGVVVPIAGDYSSSQITNNSTVAGAHVSDALNTLAASVGGVSSWNARTGAVVPIAGDYSASQITNNSTVAGAHVSDALNTLAAGVGVTSWNARTGAVVPIAGDYTASQIINNSTVVGAFVSDALNTLNSTLLSTIGPLEGGGTLQSGLTLSIAVVSNTLTGAAPMITAANLPLVSNGAGTAATWTQMNLSALAQSGAAVNQYPSWSGSAWVPATPIPPPLNPTDNNKLAVASNGSFVYALLVDANVSPTAAIAGSKIASQFGAQNLSVTGAGTLQIGTNPATTGTVRLAHGTSYIGRNLANTANILLWDFGVAAADTLTIGNGATTVNILSSQVTVTGGGAPVFFAASTITVSQPAIQFSNNIAGTLKIASSNTVAGAGLLLSIRGQIMSGTGATVGGSVAIAAGTGATNGSVSIFKSDAVTQLIKCDNTGLRLYAGATVAQAARVGQLTNSTGIAAFTLVISDVTTTTVADPVKCNQNFANLLTWGNALETAIHNIGLTA